MAASTLRFQPVRNYRRFIREESLRRGLRISSRKVQNPNLGGVIDVITTELYDQVSVNANTAFPSPTILFQTPIGQSGKTLANTDMTAAGILPNPDRFTIWAIAVHVANNTIPQDMTNILGNVTLQLYINNKWWSQGPLVAYPAGRGWRLDSIAQLGNTADAPASSQIQYSTTNGVPDPRSVALLDASVTIEQGEQFSVVLTAQTGFSTSATTTYPPGTGTTITVFLVGNRERGTS